MDEVDVPEEEEGFAQISLIASSAEESKITLRKVPDQPGVASHILVPVSEAGILVDIIVQNVGSDGLTDFSFTVPLQKAEKTEQLLRQMALKLGAGEVERDDDIAKVSVIGAALRSSTGLAQRAFAALADEGINIQMISTGDIKISVVVAKRYEELAVRALHAAFFPEAEATEQPEQAEQ